MMSESGWITIVTMIISAINGGFMIWIKYKQGVVENKADLAAGTAVQLGVKQSELMEVNYAQNQKLIDIHTDINGRVAELVNKRVELAVAPLMEQIRLLQAEISRMVKAGTKELA